ncbi:hypothetical protein O181_007673 [Austropuccinia psidii MF-1]|uniref:Uncharacterized protein n=1 Tax=Austropuccinia psidii MF-1 TaxID=1389203 RepID=A0A9Q3BMN5_9BASI|nr:hypothetical protein [Austropuccinia psidii MF-1]
MVTFSGPFCIFPKSSSQNPMPISKEDLQLNQFGNPWRQSEDHSRTPITWLCRSCVGNSFRTLLRTILRGITSFKLAVKASSISIFPGQHNWSIQAAIQSTCMSLA